jgi:hypothetical protein
MLTIDRWRKWRPSDEKSDSPPRYELTKPPDLTFGGFDGSIQGNVPNFLDAPDPRVPTKVAEPNSIPPRDPAEWREPFARWLDLACVHDPRWSGGVGCLHISFCEWAKPQHEGSCNRFTFECLLRESGFLVDEVAGVVLVSGLAFRVDLEAHERFQNQAPTGAAGSHSADSKGVARPKQNAAMRHR